jgi:hypothetical protein
VREKTPFAPQWNASTTEERLEVSIKSTTRVSG